MFFSCLKFISFKQIVRSFNLKKEFCFIFFFLGVAVISGKIFVIGGEYDDTVETVEVFNPESNTWGELENRNKPDSKSFLSCTPLFP